MTSYHVPGTGPTQARHVCYVYHDYGLYSDAAVKRAHAHNWRHRDEVGVVVRDSWGRHTVALDAVASALLSHRGQ